jgi:hypothetical protein
MRYKVHTQEDLHNWSYGDLETFLKADEYNAEYRPDLDPIINPELGLELIYVPLGWITHGSL